MLYFECREAVREAVRWLLFVLNEAADVFMLNAAVE
jgi:hypothetical protein